MTFQAKPNSHRRARAAGLILAAMASTALVGTARADADDDQALAVMKAALAMPCGSAFDEQGALVAEPLRFEVKSPLTYEGEAQPMTIWQFECGRGAYNLSHIFVKKTEYDGFQLVSFATPDLKIVNEDPENYESPVKEVTISGWLSTPVLTNAEFDPETLQITEYAKWRGLGDASNSAVWKLQNESFKLIEYQVDASYDGEMSQETLIEFK